MASETSSVLARQPSGIRAVPSNDDDDDFDDNLVDDNDYDYDYGNDSFVNGYSKVNDNARNLSLTNDNNFSGVSSSKSSESSTISSGSNASFSSGYTGSLVNGGEKYEEFESDPGKESQQKMVGIAPNGVSGIVGGGGLPLVPVAKVSGEGDDDDDDDFEFGIGEEDDGEEEGLYGVQKVVPRVRVLEEEVEEEEWGDLVETYEGDVGEGDGKVEENADVVASVSERKYTKDSTYTDVVVTGSAAAEDREDTKEPEVGGGNEETPAAKTVSVDSAAANDGVNSTDGGAVVDSSNVDAVEAVGSGTDVVEGPKVETLKGNEGEIENGPKVETPTGNGGEIENGPKVETPTANEGEIENGPKVETPTGNKGEIEDGPKVETPKGNEGEIENGPKVETPTGNKDEIENGPKLENPKGDEGKGEEVVESSEVGSASEEGGSAKVLTYAEVAASGSAAAKDRDDVKEAEVGGNNEETPVEIASADSAANVGSKYTGEEDAVVDATEAVRSGIAAVGESQEMKDSGAESKSSVAENAAKVVENSVADDLAPEDSKPIETDDVKSVGEGNSVVDSRDVGVPETVRFGVAAVGSSEMKGTEPEVKENSALAAEDVTSANDFAPLVSENPSESADDGGGQQKASQPNEAKSPQPAENVEQHNTEENTSEAELPTKQQDSTDVQQSNACGKNEKAQLDDESDTNSALVGGEIKDHSYANDLQDEKLGAQVEGDDEGLGIDEESQLDYYGHASSPNNIIEELESRDRSEIDGQVVTDSEEEGETDEEGEGKELFDSAAFAALLKAATSSGSDPGTITITSQDGSRLFSVERPAGLGPSLRSVRPPSGPRGSSFISPSSAAAPSENDLGEEEKKKLLKLQQLKVKFLRLVQRAGFTAENSVAAQVLYKLSFFGGRPAFPAFSLDNAKQTAMELEDEGKDDLDFSMTILVLGKTGVGKSAVINSIFLEEKVKINAFEPETTSVTEICGTVDGVKIRFIDVPGLKSSANEQSYNRKVLESVKKVTKKNPVDVVFYVDRLDSQTRDLNDLPMLRTITASLGSSIWRNTIITLTHASSAPPDGPSGTPLSYEVFVAQRSHIVQQSIGQAIGDLRLMNLNMVSPVSLVENHPACRKNREGQKVLPNGQAWRPLLMVLCYSVKILSEASSISKPQEPFDSRKLFGFRVRSPPLPYLLSSLLQPRAHPKLSADQGGDNVDSDIDLDDLSDSDEEEEIDEYDQLPPFKPLRKSQIAKLSGEQKKAYFEEYDYRVKLLQKKQWKEELKRMREIKKGKSRVGGYGEMPEGYDGENGDGENGAPAAVPVPLPDMALPPSFDSDNPAYRYRFLEPTSQFLARPVLDTHGWDHDCGYDGVNVEQNLGIAGRFPAAVTAQVTKDKKDFNVHLDSAVAVKHGENGSSLVGFDVQSIGKQYAYIIKGESKFKNLKKNKTTAGVSVTFLGENVASGVKVEDQITLGKRLVLVGSTGTVRSQKDAAYGANVEVRLRDADYPIGQEQSSFTLSLMKWRGDLAIGGNLQSQISVGRNSKMALRVALNNKQSGQVTVKTSSSDHISIALAGLLPIALSIYQKFRPGVSENYSIY